MTRAYVLTVRHLGTQKNTYWNSYVYLWYDRFISMPKFTTQFTRFLNYFKIQTSGDLLRFWKNVPCNINDIFWLDKRQIPLSFWWLMPKNVENSRGKTSLTFNPLPDTYFFKFVIRDIFCCPFLLTNCKTKNTVEAA